MKIITIALLGVMSVLTGCTEEWAGRSKPCDVSEKTAQMQAAAQKAQYDLQLACEKRDLELRMKVVDTCVAHGNIPVFIQGNVDCKKAPN